MIRKGICLCVHAWKWVGRCVRSSDWSVNRMAAREDTGRGQTRLFQIRPVRTSPREPRWLDKVNTSCLIDWWIDFKCLDKSIHYLLVSLADKCRASSRVVEYPPALISFNLITWGQVSELVQPELQGEASLKDLSKCYLLDKEAVFFSSSSGLFQRCTSVFILKICMTFKKIVCKTCMLTKKI